MTQSAVQSVHHLAQLNVGRVRAPLEDPLMAEFVASLQPVNALADASPGFVWRLQTEDGDATAFRVFDDERMMINMSVWETFETLYEFVYRSAHLEVFRQRRHWFETPTAPHMVLWWIPRGHIPTIEEAKSRLEHLRAHGPSATAFTLKRRFPAPDRPAPE